MRLAPALAALLLAVTTILSTIAVAAPDKSADRSSSGPRQYDHIFVIVEENEEAPSILGNANAPTINQLAQRYGLATNSLGVTHPSEPNYIALTNANFYGVADDNSYTTHQFSDPTISDRLEAAGLSWKGYFQNLPTPGFLGTCYPSTGGNCLYASKHNGFMNFTQIVGSQTELAKIVPDDVLGQDLIDGSVPNYSFIVPDQCHDMHGLSPTCPKDTDQNTQTLIRVADDYLHTTVDQIMNSHTWQTGHNAIVVTFDEGSSASGCCDANPGGGQIVTLVITNHQQAPIVDETPFNHYSLVATIEKAFGVPCTQNACDAANVPMMGRLFGLH